MISLLLKTLLVLVCIFVFWQDFKDRLVYWFLYPLIGVLGFCIQVKQTTLASAFVNTLLNLFLIIVVLFTGFIYSRLVMKKNFINETLGAGDILLFIFLCFTFSTIAFVTLFVFSMIFSLVVHQYLKNKSQHDTVPLAGYMCIFFAAVYIVSFIVEPKYLFA